MPGFFSPCGATNQIRRPLLKTSCISASGIPQLTIPFVLWTSLNANRIKFNRTSFNLADETIQFHRTVAAGIKGLLMMGELDDVGWSVSVGLGWVERVRDEFAVKLCSALI